MTALKAPNFIHSWFGRWRRAARPSSRRAELPGSVSPLPTSDAFDTRRALLDEIVVFVLAHELTVTPSNLALAFRVVSGEDHRLASAIAARVGTGAPISQAWASGPRCRRQRGSPTGPYL